MPLIDIFPLPSAMAVVTEAVVEDFSIERLRCVKDTARFFGMGVEADGERFVFFRTKAHGCICVTDGSLYRGSWFRLRREEQ
jgi:hypothetical protein